MSSPTVVGVASGLSSADALTGSAAIGGAGGPLLLVPPSGALPVPTTAWLTGAKPGVTTVYVYGGQYVLPDAVATAVRKALGG